MSKQTGHQQRKTLNAGEIEPEGSEMINEMGLKHVTLPLPTAMSSIFCVFYLIINELWFPFLSCSVELDDFEWRC